MSAPCDSCLVVVTICLEGGDERRDILDKKQYITGMQRNKVLGVMHCNRFLTERLLDMALI